MATPSDGNTFLGPRSWLPASLAWGALLMGAYLGAKFTGSLGDLRSEIAASAASADKDRALLRDEIGEIKRDVASLVRSANNTVSQDQFEVWRARLSLANPTINVPDLPKR